MEKKRTNAQENESIQEDSNELKAEKSEAYNRKQKRKNQEQKPEKNFRFGLW